jgi:hypothetical protein
MTAKDQLFLEIEQAPDELIEEVLDFLLFAKARRSQKNQQLSPNGTSEAAQVPEATKRSEQPIWELFEEFTQNMPEDVLVKLPTDGAEQHDHYLYGTPKQS